jgi:hypothetical protein
MALNELRRQIREHEASGAPGQLLVSLEAFFEGNQDLGSIGCNLEEHPGVERFYDVLRSIRARPDVQDVRVAISDPMEGEDAWPFSDLVYVVTQASGDEVARWLAPLEPEPVEEGFWEDPPVPPLRPHPGHKAYAVWWD